jgi:hypothetical protein
MWLDGAGAAAGSRTAGSPERGAGSELFPADENSEFIRYVPRQSKQAESLCEKDYGVTDGSATVI